MAVNRGVVFTLLSLVVVNMILTFGYLALVPDASEVATIVTVACDGRHSDDGRAGPRSPLG